MGIFRVFYRPMRRLPDPLIGIHEIGRDIQQMSTRKRVKKNIKEDQLVTAAVSTSRWAQEHFNQVIIGVVVLVAVIAIAVFTANSRQGASRQAETQLASAMSLFSNGEYEAARSSYEQIDDRFGGKNGTVAKFFKAECELRLGRYADALVSLDAYLGEAGDFPEFRESALYAKAMCYEGMENYSEAAAAMIAALELMDDQDPRYLDGAFQAGEFYARAGDMASAGKYFREVAGKAAGNLKDKAEVAAVLISE